MARGRFVVLVGIGLWAASTAVAQTPDGFENKVRNLAHPRYAEREKAARELETAGEPALPALRAVAQSTDEELRARAAIVAERIERTARSQRLLAAPKLALKFDKVPLDQAIAEMAKKAQRQYIVDKSKISHPKRLITMDTGEVPYWEALDAFYQTAKLAEDVSPVPVAKTESAGSNRRLIVRGSASMPPALMCRLVDSTTAMPVSTSHALRVRALPAGQAQNTYDDIKGEVTVHLDVDTAPGIPLRDIVGIEIRKATAEDGRALAVAYPVPPFSGGFGWEEQLVMRQIVIDSSDLLVEGTGTRNSSIAVTLKSQGIRPKRLSELQGVVVARVITPVEPILTVGQFLKASGRESTADGMTVCVKETNTTGAGKIVVELRLTTRTDQADDVLNFPVQMKGRVQQFIRINRGGGLRADVGKLPDFKILAASGQPLKGLSAQVTGMTYDGTTMVQDVKLTFDKPTDGADQLSLVLMGKRTAVVEMPFVLKDVPLP